MAGLKLAANLCTFIPEYSVRVYRRGGRPASRFDQLHAPAQYTRMVYWQRHGAAYRRQGIARQLVQATMEELWRR